MKYFGTIMFLILMLPFYSSATTNHYKLLESSMAKRQSVAKRQLEQGISRQYQQYILQKSGAAVLEQSWTINLKGIKYQYLAKGFSIYADNKYRLIINKNNKTLLIQKRMGISDSLYLARYDQLRQFSLPNPKTVIYTKLSERTLGTNTYMELTLGVKDSEKSPREESYLLDSRDSSLVGSKVYDQLTNKYFYNLEISNSRLLFGLSSDVRLTVYHRNGKIRKEYSGFKILTL